MARRFPDFRKAYELYADDKFVPPQFNTWGALSIIAGALERKVWLPWSHKYSFYPNIYVMLISKPGVGKSVALKNAVDVLLNVNRKTSMLNIMPSQVTEAKFIELMGTGRSFIDRSGGKEITVFQNAGYYFASEASNSLRNIFGDFIACLTDFYDCPDFWSRATKKDGKRIQLQNVCMNLLAGSTFDYLGKLVSDENIQGGFASRIIYVVHNEKMVRKQAFQGGLDKADRLERDEYLLALEHDLQEISSMVGPMHADAEFGAAWEEWFPRFEEERQSYKSEKLQSVLARTNTNALKIAMLLSASESGDRVLKLRHWQEALRLIEGVNAQVPDIFQESKASQSPGKPGNNLANFLLRHVKRAEFATLEGTKAAAVAAGHASNSVENTLQSLIAVGTIGTGEVLAGHGVQLIIKGNANDHL